MVELTNNSYCQNCKRELPDFDSQYICPCGYHYHAVVKDAKKGEVCYDFRQMGDNI